MDVDAILPPRPWGQVLKPFTQQTRDFLPKKASSNENNVCLAKDVAKLLTNIGVYTKNDQVTRSPRTHVTCCDLEWISVFGTQRRHG